ncbi:MAG: UDP-N-acetylmuramate--L-alanine ligase [Alphaproteobacteria bacterium]|nr:UDP-N-acetylmuramate--L-alanine ligase [Alphaproteobacteria bacterium]
MRTLPLSLGRIHFVGIGGIGMSGIAEILHNLGCRVQGSDLSENANVLRLRELGIPVAIGHAADNIKDAEVVVISSAVKADNAEVTAARAQHLPVVRRAEMLGELMHLKMAIAVGGAHGKTTTTSMIAALLDSASMDPTVINGGIINAYGTNARLGDGEWIVVEADESDGTFTKLPATIAVVTNIDREHLDFYGSFDELRNAFVRFVENIPFYGFAVLCIDDAEVQAMIPRVADRRIVTCGLSPQADIRGTNVRITPEATYFDVTLTDRSRGKETTLEGLRLPMPGVHNVKNALAMVAVANELHIEEATLRDALAGFGGVKRRFTRTGTVGGITVIDDYGHHPAEITAVLGSARAIAEGQVIAVFQPHRFSRVHDLFEEFCTAFNDADAVIVSDVYAAGEKPVQGVHRDAIIEGLCAHGHRNVIALEGPKALGPLVHELAKAGDYVVCLGAGDVTLWAQTLPMELATLSGKPVEVDP